MTDLHKALSDIADIQEQIVAARLFRGFGPWVIGLSGVLAFCVLALQVTQSENFAPDVWASLKLWLGVAVIALGFILAEMWALSRRHHGQMAFKMVRKVAEGFLPALVVGGILGLALIGFRSEFAKFLPPLWLYMIALGLFATMGSLHRNIYLVALWYFASASVLVVLLAQGQSHSPLHMGIPFGIGQILMGLVLARSFTESPR